MPLALTHPRADLHISTASVSCLANRHSDPTRNTLRPRDPVPGVSMIAATGRRIQEPSPQSAAAYENEHPEVSLETKRPETIAAMNGMATDFAFDAVAPPLYLASSYAFHGFERPRAYEYSRTGNPTRDQLADTIAKLEGGDGAVVVSAGMAAIDLVLCRLRPGDLILAPHDCYSGTSRLLIFRAEMGRVELNSSIRSNSAVSRPRWRWAPSSF